MANTENELLDLFADNDTNRITAAALRQFVRDVYDQMLLLDDVVDVYPPTFEQALSTKGLSAGRGWVLNDIQKTQQDTIDAQQLQIDDLLARVALLEQP